MSREITIEQIARIREAVTRLGNKSAAALELDLPRTTVCNHTRDLLGSPLGGGLNPWHASKREGKDSRDGQEGATQGGLGLPGLPGSQGSEGAGNPLPRHGWVGERAREMAQQINEIVEGVIKEREAKEAKADSIAPAVPTLPISEPIDEPPTLPPSIEWSEKGDVASVEFTTDKLIRTEQDALAHAQVDTSVWYVKSFKVGGWTTPVKLRQGQNAEGRWLPDSGHVKQNWKVHLELARIMPKPFQDASTAIIDRMREYSPSYTPIRHAKPKTPHLLELDLFDVHIGKLAWAPETGEHYDLKIAERVYREAVEDLASYSAGFEIDQIVMPIGNDFFHIDSPANTTTAGTPQDVDGRFAKVIEVGEMSVIWAIEYLMQIAPVKVLWVPGNHDRVASFHLMRTLAAWFRNTSNVDVDHSPKVRKYIHYGVNLIGFAHGDRERPASLPMIMATEEPHAWAASLYREFHLGHRHTSKRTQTTPVDTHDGVAVRTLQSLSGKDAYHYSAGFVGGRRAAEAFLMARDRVMTANYQVSLRGQVS